MSRLVISGLQVQVDGQDILRGVDLAVGAGEVHALMGPNGSGKSTLSHALMGREGYEVVGGSVKLDGQELLHLPTWRRAAAGLFLAMQYPVEVPGVRMEDLLLSAVRARGADVEGIGARITEEAARVGVRDDLLERGVNDEYSGGEQKRAETVQLALLAPRFAVLDEIDSGLDVDALRAVARRVADLAAEGLGVLAITHYARLLHELRPHHVHVLMGGRVVASGGPELATRLEERGYEGLADDLGIEVRDPV